MGGIGSGRGVRSTRFSRKRTCEESKRIEIRYFCKYMLKPGSHHSFGWTSEKSGPAGKIGIDVGEEEIILIYTTTDPETEKKIDRIASLKKYLKQLKSVFKNGQKRSLFFLPGHGPGLVNKI